MSDKKFSQRQQQLRYLVVMALADGSIGEREVNLVADRCHELGLGEGDLKRRSNLGSATMPPWSYQLTVRGVAN